MMRIQVIEVNFIIFSIQVDKKTKFFAEQPKYFWGDRRPLQGHFIEIFYVIF